MTGRTLPDSGVSLPGLCFLLTSIVPTAAWLVLLARTMAPHKYCYALNMNTSPQMMCFDVVAGSVANANESVDDEAVAVVGTVVVVEVVVAATLLPCPD